MNINPLASGNKTVAGGIVGAFVALLVAVGMVWDLPATVWWWDKAVDTLSLVGGFLSMTGIGHKAWKWFQTTKGERAPESPV